MDNSDLPGSGNAFDIVHADVLAGFPELVKDLGGEASALLAEAGIGQGLENLGGVTCRQWVRLLENAARALGCCDLGLRLAARQGGSGVFGVLGQAMQASRSFGDALAYVEAHCYAHSLASRITVQTRRRGTLTFVSHDLLVERNPAPLQVLEQLMLAGHLGAQALTGGHARVRRVHFRHEPISRLEVYRHHFGCEVRFGQLQDGVFFSESDMACPTIDSDAHILAEITREIEQRFNARRAPIDAEVLGAVMYRLLAGPCTNEAVAADLGMHVRTLHRRLTESGTSFQKIKDEVRRDVMLYYLQRTPYSFTWIADRLGFAEQSVLTRTCRRWFAMSPSEVRAKGMS